MTHCYIIALTAGDGHLSEIINLHCGHLSDDISGRLSDKISIDSKNLCGQLSELTTFT